MDWRLARVKYGASWGGRFDWMVALRSSRWVRRADIVVVVVVVVVLMTGVEWL